MKMINIYSKILLKVFCKKYSGLVSSLGCTLIRIHSEKGVGGFHAFIIQVRGWPLVQVYIILTLSL